MEGKKFVSVNDRKFILLLLPALTHRVAHRVPETVNKIVPAATAMCHYSQIKLNWKANCAELLCSNKNKRALISTRFKCFIWMLVHIFSPPSAICADCSQMLSGRYQQIHLHRAYTKHTLVFPPNTLGSIFVEIFDMHNFRELSPQSANQRVQYHISAEDTGATQDTGQCVP